MVYKMNRAFLNNKNRKKKDFYFLFISVHVREKRGHGCGCERKGDGGDSMCERYTCGGQDNCRVDFLFQPECGF